MSFRKSAFAQGETVSQSRVIQSNHPELNLKIKIKHFIKQGKVCFIKFLVTIEDLFTTNLINIPVKIIS